MLKNQKKFNDLLDAIDTVEDIEVRCNIKQALCEYLDGRYKREYRRTSKQKEVN